MKRDQARNADESGFPSPKPLNQGRVEVPSNAGYVRRSGTMP
jgi:hypothetical protein